LTCAQINSNPGALDAMAKAALTDPFFKPYIQPSQGFGGGGSEAASAGVDEGGLSSEFKNQVQAICQGAGGDTAPYQTALGNTESFAKTGTRTPAPSSNVTAEPSQGSNGSNNAPSSNQGNGGSSPSSSDPNGGGGSSQGSGSGGPPASGASGGSPSSGSQGSSSSSGQGTGSPTDNGSSGSGSSGSGGNSSSGSGSSTNGDPGIPPCKPPSCVY
jgi:hypothetical protein